jgi:hypothetical protein
MFYSLRLLDEVGAWDGTILGWSVQKIILSPEPSDPVRLGIRLGIRWIGVIFWWWINDGNAQKKYF